MLTCKTMNDLLEKAIQMYPKGTKIKSMFNDSEHTLTGEYILCNNNIQSINQNGLQCNIYDKEKNKWAEIVEEEPKCTGDCGANYCDENGCTERKRVLCEPFYDKAYNKCAEIIKEETMTQQEFNSLRIGDFISNYEILHKYNEFLIVKCDDGHDLFDLAKINKLGLKVTPKTFMGLEIKKYDSVPCEINNKELYYLFEVSEKAVLIGAEKHSMEFYFTPNSIRIL